MSKAKPETLQKGDMVTSDALGPGEQRVPLVMYTEDGRRIEIGTAVIDGKTMEMKGEIEGAMTQELSEIIGTVFRFSGRAIVPEKVVP